MNLEQTRFNMVEQQIRTYLLKELQPLITILCTQAELWVSSIFEKYPSAEKIREQYVHEAADNWGSIG